MFKGSGFCPKSNNMFNLYEASEWTPLNLDEAMRKALNNSINFFKFTKQSNSVH